MIANECTWENISMCNASRKIGNNVINQRLTGLSSSFCFGDDLLQVPWFEGISAYRLTSDVCCLIISMFTSPAKFSIPSHEATSSLRRSSSFCNLSEIYAFDFQPDIKYCQTEFCCSCFGREGLNHQYSSSAYQRLSIVSKPGLQPRGRRARPRRNGNGVNPFPWKFIYRKTFRGIFFTPS